jgi:hypothetical protein
MPDSLYIQSLDTSAVLFGSAHQGLVDERKAEGRAEG